MDRGKRVDGKRLKVSDLDYSSNELELLGERVWDRLRSEKLDGFYCTVEGLLMFVRRHGKSLKHVALRNLEFECEENAVWPILLDGFRQEVLRGNLTLESFRVFGTFTCGKWVDVSANYTQPTCEWWSGSDLKCLSKQVKESVEEYVLGLASEMEISGF